MGVFRRRRRLRIMPNPFATIAEADEVQMVGNRIGLR